MNIDNIKDINKNLNPIDSINFLKSIEADYRENNHINPNIYNMLVLSMDKILNNIDVMCNNCCKTNNCIQCETCHKYHCEECNEDQMNKISNVSCIIHEDISTICAKCLEGLKESYLCDECNNMVFFDAGLRKFKFMRCECCEKIKCFSCNESDENYNNNNDASHSFIEDYEYV